MRESRCILLSIRLSRPPVPFAQAFAGKARNSLRLGNQHSSSLTVAAFQSMPSSSDSTSHIEYEYIEDVERLEKYRPRGYHPIDIGDKLHNRYRVVHKLGYGTYSTTWLVRDEQRKAYVAVKVGTADYSAREIDILSTLARTPRPSIASLGQALIPPIQDSFKIQGPNGIHPCYVTALARTSLSGAKDGSYIRLFQPDVARALAAQVALALADTHAQGVVHGDVHLGNILLRMSTSLDDLPDEELYEEYGTPDLEPVIRLDGKAIPVGVPSHGITPIWLGEPSEEVILSEAKIILADFGEAFSPAHELRCESHTPLSARAPEAQFDPTRPLSFPSDIWALACSIWAILGQRPLFESFFGTQDIITREQVDALGMLPSEWWGTWEARRRWFTEDGRPIDQRAVRSLEDRFEDSVKMPRRTEGMMPFDLKERDAILALIRLMLSFRPEARPTASQVLKSEWMEKWALPEYAKIRG